MFNGLFPPMETETETDSPTDFCTMQVFSTGSDPETETDAVPYVYML